MPPSMRCLLIACVALTTACTAVGVVATRDPLAKLNDAAFLYGRSNRPLPAEKLIREAMEIYQSENDTHGLGLAYREYGDFLRSAAVVNFESWYRSHGFLDSSINFDNRLEKSSEFYRKALESLELAATQLESAGRYDALTNAYFNTAWAHIALGEKSQHAKTSIAQWRPTRRTCAGTQPPGRTTRRLLKTRPKRPNTASGRQDARHPEATLTLQPRHSSYHHCACLPAIFSLVAQPSGGVASQHLAEGRR
jgi:tetratricopeptide (TPR) repeat protein